MRDFKQSSHLAIQYKGIYIGIRIL